MDPHQVVDDGEGIGRDRATVDVGGPTGGGLTGGTAAAGKGYSWKGILRVTRGQVADTGLGRAPLCIVRGRERIAPGSAVSIFERIDQCLGCDVSIGEYPR